MGTMGSDFIGAEGGMPSVLWVHSLLENLKHKSKEIPSWLNGNEPN